MTMEDVKWWFKGKLIVVKLTFNQITNVYIKNDTITDKGLKFYDYCARVVFENHQPHTYQEMMFEDDVKREMVMSECDRETAAMFCGGRLAQHMKPSVFWSSERPGKFVCA